MEQIRKNDELYGMVVLDEERGCWKKEKLFEFKFNEKVVAVPLYFEISSVCETLYNIGVRDWRTTGISENEIEENRKHDLKVRERYNQYIKCFDEYIEEIQDKIIENFYEYFKVEYTDEDVKKYFSKEDSEKLLNAKTKKQILDLIQIVDINVLSERVRIWAKCIWMQESDLGINLYENGDIEADQGECAW